REHRGQWRANTPTHPRRPMATKQEYSDAAFDILSAEGYSALKQAPLCKRLNVTTGSFYHYFQNWHDFTSHLLDHWLAPRTTRLVGLTGDQRSEEHTSELQSRENLVCRLLLEKKKEIGLLQ